MHTDYYHDSDLTIGSVINVWGRKFLICDCDEFTKEYYRSKYGLGEKSFMCLFPSHFFHKTIVLNGLNPGVSVVCLA